jgi:acetoin:2,6-dichlorophenolindophenol oxidoreductase subunit alpha
VGAGIPIAAGLALAAKIRKTGQVAVCFFGDGAANEGTFHEGINMAAIWDLPVVFVCENNCYGASTHVSQVMKVANIADRASAYGIPGVVADGNDVAAVYQAARDAVARARGGNGPTLLECKTYRYSGHSRSDPGNYRPKEEVALWKERDPLTIARRRLLSDGLIDESGLTAREARIDEEIEEAVAYARSSPEPLPDQLPRHVFWEGLA